MLEIRHLDKTYAKGSQRAVHAVCDTTMTLPETGMVALFGKSGCGKTTLLNLIGGLDRSDSGEVLLDGERVSPTANEVRNLHIGYIFQNYHLIAEKTVYENVALSLTLCGVTDRAEIEKRTLAALDAVEMTVYKHRLPNTLSGGQQQRVAIARALVKNPRVILADEPTGNLDEQNTVLVMDLLRRLAKEHLILLVTHEEELLPHYCDRIIEISDGRVMSENENVAGSGYRGQSKTEVYLGDLPCETAEVGKTEVSYFGETDDAPASLRIVSHRGVLYLSAPVGVKLRVLDSSAEIRIHEGSFVPEEHRVAAEPDPVLLTPIKREHKKCGRMFRLTDGLRTGFRNHFGHMKRGKRVLAAGLFLFAFIFVMVIAQFGITIRTLETARYAHHTEISYLKASALDETDLATLKAEGIITTAYPVKTYVYDDGSIYLNDYERQWYLDLSALQKETSVSWDSGQTARALDIADAQGKKFSVAGRSVDPASLGENDIYITSGLADGLIKGGGVSYVSDYEDLMYLSLKNYAGWGEISYRIVGIVDDPNTAVYLNPLHIVEFAISGSYLNACGYLDEDALAFLAENGIPAPAQGHVYVSPYSYTSEKTYSVLGKDFIVDSTLSDAFESEKFLVMPEGLTNYTYLMNASDYVTLFSDLSHLTDYESETGFNYVAVRTTDERALAARAEQLGCTDGMVTADAVFEEEKQSVAGDLIAGFVVALAIVVVMFFCLLLVMRSGIMSSIRQVGVLRAIGVSRGNLVFRYFAEAIVVFALLIVPGYLAASGMLAWLSGKGALFEQIFYYPFWLGGATALVLFGITVFCGILPALRLLRGTPASIIAKYDI